MSYRNISELPQSVREAVPTYAGRAMFRDVVNNQLSAGKTDSVAFASAWAALQSAGYEESGEGVWIKKSITPLYGYRPLLNAQELIDWAISSGYKTTLAPEDMHVTVVYSRTPLPMPSDDVLTWGLGTVVVRGGNRSMLLLGDGSASVLVLDNSALVSEWNHYRNEGASWDWSSYIPHVTISYDGGPADVEPFTGDLVFGPIQFEPLIHIISAGENQGLPDDNVYAILRFVMDRESQYSSSIRIIKMDDEQRVVWGWASIATEDGNPVFDSHGDHIPMDELTKASIDFMENVRVGKTLHEGEQVSTVIGCLPLSQELAKAFGIETNREGLIMGFRVHDDQTWDRIKSGDLPALSIGGSGHKYAA